MTRIISYNLRSGGSTLQGNHWQKVFHELSADVVCAQESLHPSKYFTEDEFREFKGCIHRCVPNGKWGSAILSKRYCLEEILMPSLAGWVVAARISDFELDGAKRPLSIFSVHAPSPGPYEHAVSNILDKISTAWDGLPIVVAGDFNITTAIRHQSEAPLKNTKGETALLSRMRNEFGLVNAWQVLHPNKNLPQTLRWTGNHSVPYHCDGIFISSTLVQQLENAEVVTGEPWEVISDHNPLMVDLSSKAKGRS
jgi:endonuclease/exonuclease/phosphatase family metal-dependent hydrolase